MSREKRIVDQCIIPLAPDQRARWQAAARRKGADPAAELAEWIGPILDAAADYERAVGRSAAELLRLMVPVPLRPLLQPRSTSSNPLHAAAGADEAARLAGLAPAGIVVPTVGVTAPLPSTLAPAVSPAETLARAEPALPPDPDAIG